MNIDEKELQVKISSVLLQIGIPTSVAGSRYLQSAVMHGIKNPNGVLHVGKVLYPLVALKFGTTTARVERAIRHALTISWNKGKVVALNKIFNVDIYEAHECPPSSEVVALLTERIPFLLNIL